MRLLDISQGAVIRIKLDSPEPTGEALLFAECSHTLTTHGLTISLFLAGLVGSVTHCVGMCGPFVLAQTRTGPILQKPASSLLLPYHLGRMTTYVALGVFVHSIVNLAYLFSDARTLVTVPLLMMAGIIFLVSSFPSLGRVFPWAASIRLPAIFTSIANKMHRLMLDNGYRSQYLLGIILGFIPCGLVIAALMAAATAPTNLHAAIAVAAFAIGTMPSLMAIGLFGKGLTQKFPGLSDRFSRIAMVISSLWLFVLAGSLIF